MKITLKIFVVLFAVGLIGFIAWNYFPWDDKEILDADLTPITSVISKGDNIYTTLPLVTEEFRSIARKDFDEGLLSQEILSTENFVASALLSIQKPYYMCDATDFSDCNLAELRDTGKILLLHAQYYASQGNNKKAEELYSAALKLGMSILTQENDMRLIEYLVGLAVINGVIEISEKGMLNQEFIDNELAKYTLDKNGVVSAFRQEYNDLKEVTLEVWNTEQVHSTYWLQPNQTVNLMAELARMQIAYAEAPCGSPANIESEKFVDEYRNVLNFKNIVSQNFKGKMVFSVVVASLNTVVVKHCEAEVFINGE